MVVVPGEWGGEVGEERLGRRGWREVGGGWEGRWGGEVGRKSSKSLRNEKHCQSKLF